MTTAVAGSKQQHPKAALARRSLLALVITVIYVPPLASVGLKTDLGAHLLMAERMSLTGEAFIPYYLFEQATIILRALIPYGLVGILWPSAVSRRSTWEIAGVVTVVMGAVLTSQLIYTRLLSVIDDRRLPRGWLVSAGASIFLLVSAPITVFTWSRHQLLTGYVSTTFYESPTTTLLLPLALMAFWFLLDRIDGTDHDLRTVSTLGLLTVLATQTKPTFTVVFVPVVVVYIIGASARGRPVNWKLSVLGLLVPAGAVLVLQSSVFRQSGRLTFEPLAASSELLEIHRNPPWAFLPLLAMSLVLPLGITFLYWPLARRKVSLVLSWAMVAVGSALFYLFNVADRAAYGDLIGGLQVGVFVLFVESVQLAISACLPGSTSTGWSLSRSDLIVLALVGGHLVCGAFLWYREVVSPAEWW